MDQNEKDLLTDENIPESIRAIIAEKIFSTREDQENRDLERERLEANRRKAFYNAPFIIALTSLITLGGTYLVDRFTRLENSEIASNLEKLKSGLEQSMNENTAKLEAAAKEREFQYEIVRNELADGSKTNADRAAVLSFLAKAGVLTKLNSEALEQMAADQIENPTKNILPALSNPSGSRRTGYDVPLEDLPTDHPAKTLGQAVGVLRVSYPTGGSELAKILGEGSPPNVSGTKVSDALYKHCTAFLIAEDTIATATDCMPEGSQRQAHFFPGEFSENQSENVSGIPIKAGSLELEPEFIGYKYATLKLETPVANVPLLSFRSVGTIAPTSGSIFNYGIVSGGPTGKRVLWRDQRCHVTFDPAESRVNCSIAGIANGSPIFSSNDFSVVGILGVR